MSENYEKMKRPPATALRQIAAGDLKGKTDINPQWRYEIMDTTYGTCGEKWKYEIVKLWDYPTNDGTVLAFAQVNVYVKNGDVWSDPIPAIGGNTLVDMVKGYNANDPKRAKPNDEGYKMAVTDALGTALKMLGVAADIYAGRWDGSKYNDIPEPGNPSGKQAASVAAAETSEIVTAKNAVIDYINMSPCPFNDAWAKYADKVCKASDLEGLRACVEEAVRVLKKKESANA
jgi:hypothetical protein